MPNILVHIPMGSFPGDARAELVRRINEAAIDAERISGDPRKRALCWVLIEEVESGGWTCGGADVISRLLPCIAMIYLPSGVLDDDSRASYVAAIHQAFEQSRPSSDQRPLATSVVLHEVTDGNWGGNGNIWRLPQFAQAAGFAHLQHLVPE